MNTQTDYLNNEWSNKIYHFAKVTIPTQYTKIEKIVWNVALPIFISLSLIYNDHVAFCIGFSVGFLFHEKTITHIENVDNVFNLLKSRWAKVSLAAFGVIAILLMPAAKIIATLHYSSMLGARLVSKAIKHSQEKTEHAPQSTDKSTPTPRQNTTFYPTSPTPFNFQEN